MRPQSRFEHQQHVTESNTGGLVAQGVVLPLAAVAAVVSIVLHPVYLWVGISCLGFDGVATAQSMSVCPPVSVPV